jgi:uncharacterized protein (DUF1499 family)
LSFAKLREALVENQAHSHQHHPDENLRGRTYSIPFAKVWNAIDALASGGLRGWSTVRADEDLGVLRAECKGMLTRSLDDVEIRISLDENGQTRVDMSSASRVERGDLGRNARRVRRFFLALDRRVEAAPGKIIDPTLPLIRTGILIFVALSACTRPDEASTRTEVTATDSIPTPRNFRSRSYERSITFLTFQEDSTLLVPFFFSAQTEPDGVHRETKGWLARGGTWDPFLEQDWTGPGSTAPWRILPHGPLRLIVGEGDALETILFQGVGRDLELRIGELLVEWPGRRAQTFRVHRGTVVLSDQTVGGYLLDMSRVWATAESPPGDWGILLSGDSLQVVLEDRASGSGPEGGDFSLWARVSFLERQWTGIRAAWSEVRSFEPARRDVLMSWEILSAEGDLEGDLTVLNPFLDAGEGDGPMLPVEALFPVSGTLTFGGGSYPVRGLIRHKQR